MKIDISISKNDRINIGDFSGVEPNIQLSVKDVDINKSEEVSNILSELCNVMYVREFINSVNEMECLVAVNKNVLSYRDEVVNCNVESEHKELFEKLNKLIED